MRICMYLNRPVTSDRRGLLFFWCRKPHHSSNISRSFFARAKISKATHLHSKTTDKVLILPQIAAFGSIVNIEERLFLDSCDASHSIGLTMGKVGHKAVLSMLHCCRQ